MKNNSEFKRKLVINKSQLYDECKNQENIEKSLKSKTPKTMQYKYESRIVKKALKTATTTTTPLMMTTLSATSTASSSSPTPLPLSSSLAAPLTTSLKTQTATAANCSNNNLATRQANEETNKLKEIQRDPLQQLQQTELKCHLQNNNNDKYIQSPLPPSVLTQHQAAEAAASVTSVNSTISPDINTGNTLLSYVYNNNNKTNSRNNKNNDEDNKDDNDDNNTSLRVTSSATSCSSNSNNNDKDIIITSTLAAASLSSPSLIHHQRQKVIAANTTTTTTTATYKHSALYHEMDNSLSSFKFWKTTHSSCSSTSTTSCISTSSSANVIWLLALVSMFTLFGCGHAGFACLSNPCVFGVCIDGLNSSYSCYCIDGYTGIQCQTNWDECWSGPCENGGTCIDGVAYYNCTCPDGFSATKEGFLFETSRN
ncbi:myb-like protein P [Calliphora vicina]|uniref:myb-like protein P n=1 Tax=Calliphora vicina TaxID=7373 RepID=UPI00325BF080